jgi:transcriptional regulator with XRE-family HTH domain
MSRSELAKFIGNNIKNIREEHCLNQKDMADILNITRSNVSKYELGDLEINYDTLLKISKHFDISINYLFGLTPNRQIDLSEVNNYYDYLKIIKPAIRDGLTPDVLKQMIQLWTTIKNS